MAGAGDLSERLRFDARGAVNDGHGNEVAGDWQEQFTVWAGVAPMKGGEGVLSGRLEGRTPAIVTLRDSAAARGITPHWRAVDRRGVIWNVREWPRAAARAGYLDLLVERGGDV